MLKSFQCLYTRSLPKQLLPLVRHRPFLSNSHPGFNSRRLINMRTESWSKAYKLNVNPQGFQYLHNDKVQEEVFFNQIEKLCVCHEAYGVSGGDTYQWIFFLENSEQVVIIPMDPELQNNEKLDRILFALPGFDNSTFARAMTTRKAALSGNKMAYVVWKRDQKEQNPTPTVDNN